MFIHLFRKVLDAKLIWLVLIGFVCMSSLRAQTPTVTVESVALATNDMVYEPFSNRIYASLPSGVGSNGTVFGNSLTPIDPVTATIGTSVFVGSEPGRVVATENGQYLYVATTDATNIVRFDVASQTVTGQFDLGIDYGPLYAEDMETLPGQPESLGISRARRGLSPRHLDVGIFDNGVKRPLHSAGVNVLEFNDSGTRLYGYFGEISSFNFVRWDVSENGLTNGSILHPLTGYNIGIKQSGGKIYTANGKVFDPESGVQTGTFPGGIYVPDAATGRIYVLSQSGATVTVRAFSTATLLEAGSITVPNVSGGAGTLIRWGSDGLAFRTGTHIYLVRTSLVPSVPSTPRLAITDHTIVEGDAGTTSVEFRVRLSHPSTSEVSVAYATANGTALATNDYQSTFGALTFAPGETHKSIAVSINGDWNEEADEKFFIDLSNAVNATLLDDRGQTTIKNDDISPQISIADATSIEEGNSGFKAVTFSVTLSIASRQTVTVNFATANETATAGSDYQSTSGQLTFAPGETSKTIVAQVQGDTIDEGNESFQVNLSGSTNGTLADASASATILDDDLTPTVYISNLSIPEGDAGQHNAVITVSLSSPAGEPSSVSYATSEGSATAGTDYQSTSGTLNFAVGESSQTITVAVSGDVLNENNETFFVTLSNPMHLRVRTPLVRNPANGHYYEVINVSYNWTQAKATAEELAYLNARGHLATITSADEQEFINTQFSSSLATWIGGLQPTGSVEPTGGWSWITGETFSYSNWNGGEPNNANNNEDVIQIGPGGRWNDLPRTDVCFRSLFEYDVAPDLDASPIAFLMLNASH